MEENLNTAANAEGSLQEQADIYAESWEAARKRVQASLQGLYTNLIDDDFFIKVTDGAAKIIDAVSKITDTMGGLKGILMTVSSIFLSNYSQKMPDVLNNLKQNFLVFTGQAEKAMREFQKTNEDALKEKLDDPKLTNTQKAEAQQRYAQQKAQNYLSVNQHNMSQRQIDDFKIRQKDINGMYDGVIENAKAADAKKADYEAIRKDSITKAGQNVIDKIAAYNAAEDKVSALERSEGIDTKSEEIQLAKIKIGEFDQVKIRSAEIESLVTSPGAAATATPDDTADTGETTPDPDAETQQIPQELQEKLSTARAEAKELEDELERLRKYLDIEGSISEDPAESAKQLQDKIKDSAKAYDTLSKKVTTFQEIQASGLGQTEEWKKQLQDGSASYDEIKKKAKDYLTQIQQTNSEKGLQIAPQSIIQRLASLNKVNSDEAMGKWLGNFGNWFDGKGTETFTRPLEEMEELMDDLSEKISPEIAQAADEANAALNQFEEAMKNTNEEADNLTNDDSGLPSISVDLSNLGAAAMSTYTMMESFDSIVESVKNGTFSLSSVMGLATTAVGAYTTMTNLLNSARAKFLIATGLETMAIKIQTKQTWLATAALAVLKALKDKSFIAIIALVAALALLIKGIKLVIGLIKNWKSDSEIITEQIESLSTSIENVTTSLEEATQRAEEFKESVSNYDEAITALDDLREGTAEFSEQVKQANEYAQELIDTYNLIYGKDYTFDSNGVILFKEGVLENIDSEQQSAQKRAEANKAALELQKASKQAAKSSAVYSGWGFTEEDLRTMAEASAEKIASSKAVFEKYLKAAGYEDAEIADDSLKQEAAEAVLGGAGQYEYTYDEKGNKIISPNFGTDTFNAEELLKGAYFTFNQSETDREAFQAESEAETAFMAKSLVANGYAEDEMQARAIINAAKINGNDFFEKYSENLNKEFTEEQLNKAIREAGSVFAGTGDIASEFDGSEESRAKLYAAQNAAGNEETIEAIKNATYDKKNKQLLDSDGNVIADTSMADRTLWQTTIAETYDKEGEDYSDAMTSGLRSLYSNNNISDSAKMAIESAYANAIEDAEGNLVAGELDSSKVSPEDIDAIKKLTEYEDNSSLRSLLSNYDSNAYFEAQEKQQENDINSQIATYELDEDNIATQTALLQENYEALEDNANGAKQLAVNNTRMNDGLETLLKNWDDWSEVLKSGDKSTSEYAETLNELREVMGDLVGLSDDMTNSISSGFFEDADNLALLEKAANADTEAIEQLGFAVGKDLISGLEAVETYATEGNGLFDGSATAEEYSQNFADAQSKVLDNINALQAAVEQGVYDVGESLNSTEIEGFKLDEFIDSLNQMAEYTQMSVEDMQSLLNSMGLDANVDVKPITYKESVPVLETVQEVTSGSLASGNATYTTYTHQIGTQPVDSTKEVAAISYGSDKPKFNINYIGHGNASSGNKATAKKSSSGGSSSKPSTKDHKDNSTEEAELFHEVKEAISDLEHEMTKLEKAKSHLAGVSLVQSLKEENALLEQQKQVYTEYTREVNERQAQLKSKLASYGDPSDYYGMYDAIQAAYNQAIDDYNAIVDQYNAMSKDTQESTGDALLDSAEDALDNAKEAYDDANDWLEEYYNNIDTLRSNEEKQLELLYQQIENNLEAFKVELEIELDIEDAQRTVNKFLNKTQKDFKKIYTSTADWAREFSTDMKNASSYSSTIATDLQAVQEVKGIIDNAGYDYLSSDSMFGSKEEAIQYLEELEKTLMTDAESLYDLYSSSWDSYLTAMDEAVSQWSDIVSGFEDINSDLDHYAKIVELIYGGSENQAGRDYLDQIYSASANNSLSKQSALAQEIQALNETRAELLAAGASEADQDIQKLDEAIQTASDSLTSEIESYIDTIQNQFTNAITSIMEAADKALTNNIGGNTLIERWQKAQDAAEGYYDDVERIYELESLESKWEDLINSTSTVKNQQYLKSIMDSQLSNLRDKTKLSEYDIGLAEKELAIYQAQLALEEAQNNKNTMKLTRNEAGDWTYNYVADEDDVADKQEALLTSLQEKYEYVKNASVEITQKVMELYQTAQEELSALMEEYKNADETRRAEIQEEYDYLYNYYYGEDGLIVQKCAEATSMQNDLNVATMESIWALYEVDQENFNLMTDNEKQLIEDLRDNSIESLRELLETVATDDGSFYNQMQEKCAEVCQDSRTEWQQLAVDVIQDWATNPDSVRNIITGAYNDIMGKVNEYDNAIVQSEQISGIEWSKVSQQVAGVTSTVGDLEAEIGQLMDLTSRLSNYRSIVQNLGNDWSQVQASINDCTSSLKTYLELLTGEAQNVLIPGPTQFRYQSTDLASKAWDLATKAGGSESNGSSDNSGSNNNTSTETNFSSSGRPIYDASIERVTWYNRPFSSYNDADKLIGTICNKTSTDAEGWEVIGSNGKYWLSYQGDEWEQLKNITPFASGGYTGDWNGGNGRLAMLHSKELVLNTEDTKNMLSVVSAVRDISSLGSSISNSIAAGLSNIMSNVLNLRAGGFSSLGGSSSLTEGNTFNITAEFPNAENVNEIREAILSLPTLASQYLAQA